MDFKFRGTKYREAANLTFAETFAVEKHLKKDVTEATKTEQIFAGFWVALKRAGQTISWEELLDSNLEDDFEIIEPEPEPEVEYRDHPLDDGAGTAESSKSLSQEPDPS